MSNGDIIKVLQPNQSINVQVRGEFIYLKEGLGAFDITVFDQTTSMMAGDSRRFERLFDGFEIKNLSDMPRRVVMVVGTGDFDRFIVQGQIAIEARLRKSTGEYVSDFRHDLSVDVKPAYKTAIQQINKGDFLYKSDNGVNQVELKGMTFENGILKTFRAKTLGSSVYNSEIIFYDKNLNVISSEDTSYMSSALAGVNGFTFCDGVDGGVVWVKNKTGSEYGKLFYYSGGSANVLLDTGSRMLFAVAYNSNDKQFLLITSAGDLLLYDFAGEKLAEITGAQFSDMNLSVGTCSKVSFNKNDNTFTVSGASVNNFVVLSASLEVISSEQMQGVYDISAAGTSGTGGGNRGQLVFVGQDIFVAWDAIEVMKFKGVQPKPITFAGYVSKGGCASPLLRRDLIESKTTADVTVIEKDGLTYLNGEVIKAVLEMYHGREIIEGFNYLDSVYSIEIHKPNNGALTEVVKNGGGTLAAAEIKDDFSVVFPSRINLVIDETLKFKEL